VLPAWAGRDSRTITPNEVIDLLDAIVERSARTVANKMARLLSLMFRFGAERRIVQANPVQLMKLPGGPETPRDRALSGDELHALLSDPAGCAGKHIPRGAVQRVPHGEHCSCSLPLE
jgi:hypothetical protein